MELAENDKNYTESGMNGQNNAVNDLNAKCEQKNTEICKNIYPNRDRSHNYAVNRLCTENCYCDYGKTVGNS